MKFTRLNFKSLLCRHEFEFKNLQKVPASKASHNKRVLWTCSLCGKAFYAHCGIDISQACGRIKRDHSE